MTSIEHNAYARRSRRYLAQSGEELARGDLLQASEKGWGAASQMVKAIASERGWAHGRHDLLYDVVRRVVAETKDGEYTDLFLTAGSLHGNFYEEYLEAAAVRRGLTRVAQLVSKLEVLLAAA